jgi:sulfotransferase family protein
VSREQSPLRGRMIFNVGSRRSGTFWLQRIVAAHPEVSAVGSETHLFSHGIAPLAERFHHAALGSGQVGTTFIERDTLLDALRDFCDTVFAPMLAPGTSRLAERTPLHALHTGLIGDIYPDGRIVHIIRDGRDVVRSLLAQRWGPENVAEGAREWRAAIETARAGAGNSARYLEVRYEDLHADPSNRIAGLYHWLGLPVDEAILERAVTEAKVERNLDPKGTPAGSGKWRDAFTADDLAAFEEVAGELLDDLGYARAAAHGSRARPGLRARLRRNGHHRVGPVSNGGRVGEDVDAQRHLDALLNAFHTAPERAGELLGEGATVRVVDGATERAAGGQGARELLVAALREDGALNGRQIRGDVHPEPPMFAVMLRYDTPRGVADRVLVARLAGDRVQDLTLYRPESGG